MRGATMLQHLRRGAAVAPVPLVRLVAGPNRLGSAPAHWSLSLAAAASWRAATKLTAGARRLCAMHPTRVVRVDGDETQVCDAPHALLHVLFSHAPEMQGGQHTEHAILTQVTARDPPEACILTESYNAPLSSSAGRRGHGRHEACGAGPCPRLRSDCGIRAWKTLRAWNPG
jgi:hypothetical protein